MIHLMTDTPQFFADIGEVLRLFYGDVMIDPECGDVQITHAHVEAAGVWRDTFTLSGAGVTLETPISRVDALTDKRMMKRAVKSACYALLTRVHGVHPPWGSLTGVRPQKLLDGLLEEGMAPDEALRVLTERFDLGSDKARLLMDIIAAQKRLPEITARDVDIYIGIPFCTTRCTYCTFSSGEIQSGKLVGPYLDALVHEIQECARLLGALEGPEGAFRIRAAYMGGGTPTALSARELDRLLCVAQRAFPGALEWTVEAGRPDTIDRDKLQALKSHGVTRISVNPQTFHDRTLRAIGRAHTVGDTLRAFALAREMGFNHINMDLIAALPGEDEAMFGESLRRTLELAPESVTVHTLAVKRASKLRQEGYGTDTAGGAGNIITVNGAAASRMVDEARRALCAAGYEPYYMYRQKYMADNLENVGYALPGRACMYNVDIMQETTRTLAMGAGAITKWLFDEEPRIRRAPNVRDIRGYVERVDEMISRKRTLIVPSR